MEPSEPTVLKPETQQAPDNRCVDVDCEAGQSSNASKVQLPAGTEPVQQADGLIQITEADMKKVYRHTVEHGLKKIIGEVVNIEAYVDEIADTLCEYDVCNKHNPDDLSNLQTIMVNLAAFALAAAAGFQAIIRTESEKRRPQRTIGQAAQEVMNAITPNTVQVLERSRLVTQHLSLNSTVCIHGTNYEIRRSPLTWDGTIFSAPHGPQGAPRFYTIAEAIFHDFIVPVGAPSVGKAATFGQFNHKGVDYELLSPHARWVNDWANGQVEYRDPQVPTLSYRHGIDHAIAMGWIRQMTGPHKKMFTANGILYGIRADNVDWEPHNNMVVVTRGLSKVNHTIPGAIAAGLIDYIRLLSAGGIH